MAFHNYKSTEFVLLVSQRLGDWKNAIGKSRGTYHRHEKSQRHKEYVEKANVLMSNTENNKSLEEKLDSVFKERVKKNKKILLSIQDVILQLDRTNIPLRGSYDISIFC